MKKFYSSKIMMLVVILNAAFMFNGCLQGEFDSPPIQGSDPVDITADKIVSLTDVLKIWVPGSFTPVALDKYLKAVVVADDKSGSFYKQLVLEDENSDLGITVVIEETELHYIYPVGRRVFIHLKDLLIGDYNGLPQLGMGVDKSNPTRPELGRIPATLLPKVMVKGVFGLEVKPRIKKISELNAGDLNTLIQLQDVQIANVGETVTYANVSDPANLSAINHDIVDCANAKIVFRSSQFSDYAYKVVPAKNGTFTAVYGTFGNTRQLALRQESDIVFDKDRCGSGGGGNGSLVTIASIRTLFSGTEVSAPASKVKGIVISDVANKNINGQNLVVQDGTAGIILRFKAAINIPVNTEVEVDITGGKIGEFNGVLQVQDLTNTNAKVIGSGSITPKVITASQADPNTLESTLVKFDDVELTGSTTYSVSGLKIKDGSGEVLLYTANGATFAGQAIKTGKVSVTAIISEFKGERQVTLRSLNDVVGGSGGCDTGNTALDCDNDGVLNGADCAPNDANVFPGKPCDDGNSSTTGDTYNAQCQCVGQGGSGGFDETFSSQTNNQDINLPGWSLVAVKGDRKWQGKLFSGNTYAQATAFGTSGPVEMESWMITPSVATGTTGTLSFESAKAFWKHDALTVWVTTNYTGDPATTTWTAVNAKIAKESDADNTFIPSGNIDLKPFGANVRIGFKHVGDKSVNTSTYRIDNVKVF